MVSKLSTLLFTNACCRDSEPRGVGPHGAVGMVPRLSPTRLAILPEGFEAMKGEHTVADLGDRQKINCERVAGSCVSLGIRNQSPGSRDFPSVVKFKWPFELGRASVRRTRLWSRSGASPCNSACVLASPPKMSLVSRSDVLRARRHPNRAILSRSWACEQTGGQFATNRSHGPATEEGVLPIRCSAGSGVPEGGFPPSVPNGPLQVRNLGRARIESGKAVSRQDDKRVNSCSRFATTVANPRPRRAGVLAASDVGLSSMKPRLVATRRGFLNGKVRC